MITIISSVSFSGIKTIPIEVQTSITNGLPAFQIVGLADKSISESRERIRAAITAIGLLLPPKRIIVNLSPADITKEGTYFDLPIACGVLLGMKVFNTDQIKNYTIIGELALDGRIVKVSGALPAAVGAKKNKKGIICPKENLEEVLLSGIEDVLAVEKLPDIIDHFSGKKVLQKPNIVTKLIKKDKYEVDFKDIIGNKIAKRAMEIAAVGNHHVLMSGHPGVGKSMLANAIISITPEMSYEEALECSMINSIVGSLELKVNRPFRSPHHSCSVAAMIGGGSGKRVKPGEISLAHNGILFLDELPEFSPHVLDSLRQPLESGKVFIARADAKIEYPSKFQLVAAMNPCRCGYLGDEERECSKTPKCGVDYLSKISGPIIDRFDIYIEVSGGDDTSVDSSEDILKRVINARKIRKNVEEHHSELLQKMLIAKKISMRGYKKIISVASSIASLEDKTNITENNILEALSYRNPMLKNFQ